MAEKWAWFNRHGDMESTTVFIFWGNAKARLKSGSLYFRRPSFFKPCVGNACLALGIRQGFLKFHTGAVTSATHRRAKADTAQNQHAATFLELQWHHHELIDVQAAARHKSKPLQRRILTDNFETRAARVGRPRKPLQPHELAHGLASVAPSVDQHLIF